MAESIVVRDIDLVIISGAGASHDLGVQGDKFPMMEAWSQSLSSHLSASNINYLEATGLQSVNSGEDFEKVLGNFLRGVQSLKQVRGLLTPSTYFPGVPQSLQGSKVLETWYEQSINSFENITSLIYESLYQEFGARHADTAKAQESYRDLLIALGIVTKVSVWTMATTNYDWVAEEALLSLGHHLDRGFVAPLHSGGDGRIDVSGMVSQIDSRRVPILHLHGAIGWYKRDDGSSYVTNVTRHDTISGTPIIMLPDPMKSYETGDAIEDIWSEFRIGLARAKKVFVFGHSVNDPQLIRALSEEVEPKARIAVGLLGNGKNGVQFHQSAKPIEEKINEVLGGTVTLVPIIFGQRLWDDAKTLLANWRQHVESIST